MNILRFSICVAVLSVQFLFGADYVVVPDKATVLMLSNSLKDRKTLKLRLENGLQVYLISDPNAEQSAGALVVETGSWEEPVNNPGLAHFLEHMLFLGTVSYPDEGGYHRYIAQHGGMDNAFTANDETAYVFSINNDALGGTLKRFASFFKEPLFNPSGVSRELHAIDQEYAKNVENDNFRVQHVLKTIAKPDHPENLFHMGNSQSLANTSPETLKKWFQEHYSANIMKLMVYSSVPLDTLTKMVVEDFKGVPTNNRQPFSVEQMILPENGSGQLIFIEPIQNTRELHLLWELPNRFAMMIDSHPGKIVCHILGHEGKNSLLAELKKENLATGVSCGIIPESRNHHMLDIQVELTEQGLKKYATVVERVYQTIALMREQGIPPSLIEEVQKQALLDYQFQERRQPFKEAMYHAIRLPNEDLSTYPEQSELISRQDPQAINALIQVLKPENGRVIILAPSRETKIKTTEHEPWLGVAYTVKPVPKTHYTRWLEATPNSNITFPEVNPYLPSNFKVLESNAPALSSGTLPLNRGVPLNPKVLGNETISKVYYAQDTLYRVPKVNFIFTIRTPEITPTNPKSIALAELYTKCVQDSLSDVTYHADLAGLKFVIKGADNENGIRLQVQGYSDKAPKFFDAILENLKNPSNDETLFNQYKDNLLRSYANKALDSPLDQSFIVLKAILYKNFATPKEKEMALKKTTFEEYQTFVKNLYTSHYIEGVIYGNISLNDASKVTENLLAAFPGTPYPPSQHYHKELLHLSDNSGPYYLDENVPAQGNAAMLAIEGSEFTYENRAAQQILLQAIREAFYNVLRTQQQTGYLVYSGGEEVEGELIDYFAVQSSTHDSRELLSRFELFIEDYLRDLTTTEIPQERFDILKSALMEQMRQPPKDLDSMAELINELAFNYFGIFDRPEKRIDGFEKLIYKEFVPYAKESLGQDNTRRLGILLRGAFPEQGPLFYKKVRNRSALRSEGKYLPDHRRP